MYAANADYESEMSELMQYFSFDHLKDGPLKDASREFYDLAFKLYHWLPTNGEKAHLLRKLLEAKDCAVRAALHIPADQR